MAKKTVFGGKHPKLSKFDLSHEHKLTCDMGKLVPVMCTEVMPGDTFSCNSDMFLRLMPLASPMMHRVDCYVHYFFVPTRLVWNEWDTFLTGGPNGDLEPVYPYLVAGTGINPAIGELSDYFGIPRSLNAGLHINALPFRAYNLIFNEWYRDETLIEPKVVNTSSGEDTGAVYDVWRRAWKKGYFESALPWTQRGTAAQVPFEGSAPVVSLNGVETRVNVAEQFAYDNGAYRPADTKRAILGSSSATAPAGTSYQPNGVPASAVYNGSAVYGNNVGTNYDQTTWANVPNFTGLVAALSESGLGIDIRDLRLASAVQRFLEKNARGGVRYIEWLYSHFGVRSSDARLQRPEYLGGGKSPIVIGEVLQNSETNTTPQGWMAGQAVSAQKSLGWTRSFEEYGYVIGILSIMPRATYEQGLPRMWSRFGRYDQILPAFAGIGDQGVPIKELYANSDDPEKVFGYVPRYEECRRIPSTVHGDFRLDGGTLGYWHMGRYFEDEPVLSGDFVECKPTNRVFAVEDAQYQKCLVDIYHNLTAIRPLPRNGVPGIRSL